MPSWSGASLLLTIGVTFVILALLVPRAKFPRQDFEYPSPDGHYIRLRLIEFLILLFLRPFPFVFASGNCSRFCATVGVPTMDPVQQTDFQLCIIERVKSFETRRAMGLA